MEQQYIQYLSPEEIRNIDPSLIDFMTMTNGTIIKVGNHPSLSEFTEEQICPHCTNCSKNKMMTPNIVLRGKTVEGQAEDEQKEVLRGPDGKPLLSDILSGGDYLEGDQVNQDQNEGTGEVQQGEGEDQQEEGYYDDGQYAYEDQYVQEENENVEGNGYEGEYYDPNYQYEGMENEYNQDQAEDYPQGEDMNNEPIPQELSAEEYQPYEPEQPQENNIVDQPSNELTQQPNKPMQQPVQPVPVQPQHQPFQPSIPPKTQPAQPKPQNIMKPPKPAVGPTLPGRRNVGPIPSKVVPPRPVGPQKGPMKNVMGKPMPPGKVKPMPPGMVKPMPPRMVKPMPPQPPRVVMPPGQQKKVVPIPQVVPKKIPVVVPPKSVLPGKGFRARPPQSGYGRSYKRIGYYTYPYYPY